MKKCIIAALAASTCLAQPAFAEDAEDENGTIVVTGARTGDEAGVGVLGTRPVLDIPLSVTGYTDDMILDQGARSASEVLANDPSIRLQGAGDGSYDFFTVRGFSMASSAFALNGLYGVLPWNTFSPETVEQFEVVRGPSTALTGTSPFDNPGGSINIRPKRADDAPLTRLNASLDFGGQAGLHADIGRRFGQSGEWGVRINGAFRDGGLAREHQSERVGLASLGADYRGERFRFSLDAGYQNLRTDGASFLLYIYEGTEVPVAPETDNNISPEWSHARSEDYYGAARAEFDVTDDVMLFAAIGARDHQSFILNPYSEMQDGEGNLFVYPYGEHYFAKTNLSAEGGVRAGFDTGPISHQLVVSGSLLRFNTGWQGSYSDGFAGYPEYESNIYSPTYPASPDLSLGPDEALPTIRNRLSGVSFIDTLSIADGRYQLLVGARYQKFDIERLYDGTAYEDSAWSPSVGLNIELQPNISLYANYMVGLSQGPFAPVGTANQNVQFAPVKTTQYEAGLKARFGDLFTSLALFEISQPAGLTDPVTNIFSLNGEQRHRGVEWTFAGDIANGIRVLGGVNYLDAELVSTEGGLLDGNRVPGVPEWTANLGGEVDLGFVPGLTLTGRLIYTDDQYVYGDNLQSIPDWARLDLGARFATEFGETPVTFRLNVTNVTGADYWASAKGFGLTLGSPRSALLSATVDF